jgi:hypothetical protein
MGLYSINMDSFDGCIRQHDLTLFNPGMPEHTAGCWAAAILCLLELFVLLLFRSRLVWTCCDDKCQATVCPSRQAHGGYRVTITFAWKAASTPWNLFIVSIVVEADSFTRAGCSDGNGILWDISGSEPHSRIFGFGYNVSV